MSNSQVTKIFTHANLRAYVEFYKQPKEILLKVIDILEKQNKAAKIEIGSDISVKFL